MAITIYTAPACTQCSMTKRVLDRADVTYTSVDVSTDLDAHRFVTRVLGYRAAPVIYVEYPGGHTDHWSGFQPTKLDTYIKAFTGGRAA